MKYENPAFPWPQLARVEPSDSDGERIHGVKIGGDGDAVVQEGQEYPMVGMGEDWIENPQGEKRGLRIAITEETIWRDKTGEVLRKARGIGEALGVRKNVKVTDLAMGVLNTYRWMGTAYDTYQASSPWANSRSSAAVAATSDYSLLNGALAIFGAMTDPVTGWPIIVVPTTIICHSTYAPIFAAIQAALKVVKDTNPSSGTQRIWIETPPPSVMFNGQQPSYQILSSPWIDQRYTANSIATTTWYFGDFLGAFSVMEQWPFRVIEAPPTAGENWSRDIVFQCKARERYGLAVMQPRKVQKNAA